MIEIGIISNPSANSGKNLKVINLAIRTLRRQLGNNYKIHNLSSHSFQDALKNARDAIRKNLIDSLIVLGGDGMVNLGVNAVVNTKVKLGIIPVGSGNDFAEHLKIPINNIEKCLKTLSSNIKYNKSNFIDVGRIDLLNEKGRSAEKRYFAGSLSAGIDSKICDRANNMKFGGKYKYLIAGIIELLKIDYSSYNISWDDQKFTAKGVLCTVSNSPRFGGGFLISPKSRIDDGYLDFIFAKYPGKLKSMYLFLRALNGKHIKSKEVSSIRLKEVILKNSNNQNSKKIPKFFADGEFVGSGDARISVVPKSVLIMN